MAGPIPNNPNVVKVALVFSRDSRILVNTFHVSRAGGWSTADMAALANLVKTWWSNFYKQCIPATVFLTNISVRVLDPLLPLAYDLPVSPADPGTRPGVAEAANVSVTLSERTGLAGRAFRGRMYLPSISETDVSGNDVIVSVLASLLASAISNLISSIAAVPPEQLTIFHRPHIPPHPLDNGTQNVISYVIESIVDSQRRRLPGRGR